jgi:hypothetical protein
VPVEFPGAHCGVPKDPYIVRDVSLFVTAPAAIVLLSLAEHLQLGLCSRQGCCRVRMFVPSQPHMIRSEAVHIE